MSDFQNSQEQAFRRLVREAIRKCPDFTKSERDVVLAVINHWFHHKGGPKDYIHPGRNRIAKRAKVSVRTVATTLSKLRAIGVLTVVSNLNGGRATATRYDVDVLALMVFCGHDWVQNFRKNCTVSDDVFARYRRAKIAHCIKDVTKGVSRTGSSDV